MSGEPSVPGPVALVSDATAFAGAEVYASTLVRELAERCNFVAVLGDRAPEEAIARLSAAGAEIRIVDGLRRMPSIGAPARLARILRRLDPALVHVNLSDQGGGLAAAVAGAVVRRPLVGTLHLVLPERARWREALSARALRRYDRVIAVSAAVARYLEERGCRAVVVPNGITPTPQVSDPRAALGLEPEAFVVGGIGRLHEQKGWDVLCRAAVLVRRELPDAVFVVVGEGPELDRLTAIPECAGVRFAGYRPAAASLVSGFNVLAVPSRYEGFGLTAVEALLQSVPVVATSLEAVTEVLGDAAVLVPPNDPEALAAGILRIASDTDLREALRARGATRARELFTAERMAEETLRVYRSVVGGGAEATATVSAMDGRSQRGKART